MLSRAFLTAQLDNLKCIYYSCVQCCGAGHILTGSDTCGWFRIKKFFLHKFRSPPLFLSALFMVSFETTTFVVFLGIFCVILLLQVSTCSCVLCLTYSLGALYLGRFSEKLVNFKFQYLSSQTRQRCIVFGSKRRIDRALI